MLKAGSVWFAGLISLRAGSLGRGPWYGIAMKPSVWSDAGQSERIDESACSILASLRNDR
jgi:hypothetical protein